jgi:hypothetical protein
MKSYDFCKLAGVISFVLAAGNISIGFAASCVDDKRAFLTLLDVGVKLQRLFEGHPDGSREVLRHRACLKRER